MAEAAAAAPVAMEESQPRRSGRARKPTAASSDSVQKGKKRTASKNASAARKGKGKKTKSESAAEEAEEKKEFALPPPREDIAKVDVDTKGKDVKDFRNYKDSARQERVSNFYKLNHTHQTVDYVRKMHEKYLKFELCEMGVWECLEYLDTFVDDSDPDTENSQMQHALQTAEAVRAQYPGEEYDWLHLTALIHDLGKLISPKGGEPQWGTVGDTFPVGCAFSDKCVFPEFFKLNPDNSDPRYNTKLGIYKEHCGLSNVLMSWGHDEYLYQVCVHNKATLPLAALYIIRFHSFYPWHKEGAYEHLLDEQDKENLKWIHLFNQYDLYSKSHGKHDLAKLAPYYKKCIAKYFPAKLKW